jgi:hypothetical protein
MRRLIALVAAVVAGIVAYYFVPPPLPEISRSEFWEEVHAGHIGKIEIYDGEWILSKSTTRGEFRTVFDKQKDAGLADQLRAQGIEIWYSTSPLGI